MGGIILPWISSVICPKPIIIIDLNVYIFRSLFDSRITDRFKLSACVAELICYIYVTANSRKLLSFKAGGRKALFIFALTLGRTILKIIFSHANSLLFRIIGQFLLELDK